MVRKYYRKKYPRLFKSYGQNIDYNPEMILPIFDEQAYDVLQALISSSSRSIYITLYDIRISKPSSCTTVNSLIATLKFKRQQGIDVKIILNGYFRNGMQSKFNEQAYLFLRDDGFNIICTTTQRILHTKLFIFDESKTFLGSHNLSATSLQKNYEASILINNHMYSKPYVEYFKKIWNENTQGNESI